MTGYAQMTDTEINRAVAGRLGWALDTNKTFARPHHYELTAPSSRVYLWTAYTAAQVWDDLFAGVGDISLPSYATDANAALELVSGNRFEVRSFPGAEKHPVRVVILSDDGRQVVGAASAATPARAICEAWLAYMDAKAE